MDKHIFPEKKGFPIQKKYVTLQEARTHLPRVLGILDRLIKLNETLFLLSEVEIEFDDEFRGNLYDITLSKKFHKLSTQFFTYLQQLHNMSCIVKDIEIGLIDFYALHEGREIFLCYRYGEADITHWHEIGDGYTGRQSVSSLEEFHRNTPQ